MQACKYDIQNETTNTYYKRNNSRKCKKYYIKQKLIGLCVTAFGLLIPFIADGDATMSLLLVPMGLFLVFTKEKVLMIR